MALIAYMNLAMQASETYDIDRMQELVESHIPKPGEADMRGFEWCYLWRLYHLERELSATVHGFSKKSFTVLLPKVYGESKPIPVVVSAQEPKRKVSRKLGDRPYSMPETFRTLRQPLMVSFRWS